MKIPIKTNDKKIFRQILELFSSCIYPITKLRNRELDVLAEFMYYNYLYRDVKENIRYKVVSDTDTRKEMRKFLDMSEDTFNNNLSIVKKHKLIDKDNKLVRFLQILPEGDLFKIEFDFKKIKE